jgi:hypothetical protein
MPHDEESSGPTAIGPDSLLQHSTLDLIRNPSLVPAGSRGTYDLLLAAVEDERKALGLLKVLSGMTPEQQTEVAALALDIEDEVQRSRASSPSRVSALRKLSTQGPGHIRFLGRKLDRIRLGLTGVAADSDKVDVFIGQRLAPHLAEALAAVDRAKASLTARHETIEQYTARMRNWRNDAARVPSAKEVQRRAIRQLVAYFRANGSPTDDHAHVRTARIANARWGWRYHIEPKYGGEECPGIRQLLKRLASEEADAALASAPHDPHTRTVVKASKAVSTNRASRRAAPHKDRSRPAHGTTIVGTRTTARGSEPTTTRSRQRTPTKKRR